MPERGTTPHTKKKHVGVLGGLPPDPGSCGEARRYLLVFLNPLSGVVGLGAHAWANTHNPRDNPGSSSSTSSYLLHHPSHLHQLITSHRHFPFSFGASAYYQLHPTSCSTATPSIQQRFHPSAFTTTPARRLTQGRRPSPHMTLSYASHISASAPIPFTPKNALIAYHPYQETRSLAW